MTDIQLKAPKSVIKSYGLEEYCSDKEIINKIKEEELQVKRDEELRIYNNQFTLMQHGRVIFEDSPKDVVMSYLENHQAKEVESIILKNMQPIFDHFKNINKLYIGKWGQYWENECRGEKMNYTCEVDGMNEKLLDPETFRELYELFENNMYYEFDDRTIELKYGWPELSFSRLAVERTGRGKLKISSEDYTSY